MSERPKGLDLFAGAGGCSVGYALAGLDMTGVDIEAHPDYPFELIVGDALEVLRDAGFLASFDFIHASPPCPLYSTITPESSREDHPDLIPVVRAALQSFHGPWIIENVEGAWSHMRLPVKLCGSAFGLRVRRHRLFESNRFLTGTECYHHLQKRPVGVYGDHAEPTEFLRPNGTRRGWKARSVMDAADAMGIDWMTSWDDLADAIPPAYCRHLGEQLIEALEAAS